MHKHTIYEICICQKKADQKQNDPDHFDPSAHRKCSINTIYKHWQMYSPSIK